LDLLLPPLSSSWNKGKELCVDRFTARTVTKNGSLIVLEMDHVPLAPSPWAPAAWVPCRSLGPSVPALSFSCEERYCQREIEGVTNFLGSDNTSAVRKECAVPCQDLWGIRFVVIR
jgi:hypothetical protein